MEGKQIVARNLFIAMMILPIIVVSIRFWSRALMPSNSTSMSKVPMRFWWDDWAALAAMCFNIASLSVTLQILALGLGRHVEVVNPDNLELFLKLLAVDIFLFASGCALVKASALLFYARVFGVIDIWFKYTLWIVHGLNAALLIASWLVVLLQCSSFEKVWKTDGPGSCANIQMLWLVVGVTSLLLDLIILVLPLPILLRMQLRLMRKALLVLVFICGYLAVAVSIGRLISTCQAGKGMQLDLTYNMTTPVIWMGFEVAIAIISISLPALLALGQRAQRGGVSALFHLCSQQPSPRNVANQQNVRLGLARNRFKYVPNMASWNGDTNVLVHDSKGREKQEMKCTQWIEDFQFPLPPGQAHAYNQTVSNV